MDFSVFSDFDPLCTGLSRKHGTVGVTMIENVIFTVNAFYAAVIISDGIFGNLILGSLQLHIRSKIKAGYAGIGSRTATCFAISEKDISTECFGIAT